MWSPSTQAFHAGLSATRLTIARPAALWRGKAALCESVECVDAPRGERWRPVVNALAEFIAQKSGQKIALSVILSGQFTRWQLLPWTPELSHTDELTNYAKLRFRQAFGPVADAWQIRRATQPPGRTVPVCAVDAGLVDVLRSMCASAGIRLVQVRPYFSAAFDHWRGNLKANTAWFGVVEPNCVSLGLLQGGNWTGLRAQRFDGDWRDALPGLMAEVGIAAGQDRASPPLYLAGAFESPASSIEFPFVRLSPKANLGRSQVDCGMAFGL